MDYNEIKRTLDVFRHDNNLVEVRVMNSIRKQENYSGIFDNFEDLWREIQQFDKEPYTVYFVFNELKDALSAYPQQNKFLKGATTVSDKNIKYRRWILVDFDPIRDGGVSDIPATDEEFESAHQKALEVYKFLRNEGFALPVVCKSGNGWHLNYRIDNIPNTEESDTIVKNFLGYLSMRFSDDKADVDTKNKNAARLTKFYGTTPHKGGQTADRPHRKSEIVKVPNLIVPVDWELVKKFASQYEEATKAEVQEQRYYGDPTKKFNLDAFLAEHNIEIDRIVNLSDGGRKIILKHCPFNPEHKEAAIFDNARGNISFTCFHNSCGSKTWRDFRLFYDPHAYDRKDNWPQNQYVPQQRQAVPQKPKYEIKEESPELGKKWMCMSDIEKVDLTKIENIKTGFDEIDRLIVGLNIGEVSIVSGSNGSGKSSWLNSLILNAIDQGYKTALWSGELPAYILKSWILQVAAGKWNAIPSSIQPGKYFVGDEVAKRIDEWMDGKFFLYNNEYTNKWQQVFHDMDELVKLGVKLFILDNLFSLDIDIFDGDKLNKQKELILQLCRFAKANAIHMILVAHPRKSMSFLRKNDIAGTGDLINAVDNIFIVHRVGNDFVKAAGEFLGTAIIQKYQNYGNCVEIAKNRMYGIIDQMVGLYYEQETRRFKNADDEQKHYGWEGVSSASPISHLEPNCDFFAGMDDDDDLPFD